MYGKRKITCIYREKETVIVTCGTCGKPRLMQYQGHWRSKIPMIDCASCGHKKGFQRRLPSNKLKDFEDMLDVLEIVQANYTTITPLMVRTTVNAMLTAYRRT
jgi:transcription elongation factor Elf1